MIQIKTGFSHLIFHSTEESFVLKVLSFQKTFAVGLNWDWRPPALTFGGSLKLAERRQEKGHVCVAPGVGGMSE